MNIFAEFSNVFEKKEWNSTSFEALNVIKSVFFLEKIVEKKKQKKI